MNLMERAHKLLNDAIALASPEKELEGLVAELYESQRRLNEPLKIAVVGLIKAGKSTLMNALIGEKLLITGDVETTFRYTWFRYGEKPELLVHMQDGRIINDMINNIAFWTVRSEQLRNAELNQVEYVEVRYPNVVLQEMEFIDTPGLGSTHVVDSANTLDFIGMNMDEADEVTKTQASGADAIIYGFSLGLAESDQDVLEAFQESLLSNASPINALAAFTRVDIFWSSGIENPLSKAEEIVGRYQKDPRIRRLLYTILPVCGLMAQNSQMLEASHLEILQRLSQEDASRIQNLLQNAKRFCTRDYDDITVTARDREQLFVLLGQYGIYLALQALREGMNPNELASYLNQMSGVPRLSNLIIQHFGNRAFLIKLRNAMNRLRKVCFGLQINNNLVRNTVQIILNQIGQLEIQEHAFEELRVLQYYYNGELELEEAEAEEFKQLMGEYGIHVEARLGVTPGTCVKEMAKLAREKASKWITRANDCGIYDRAFEDAARVTARSCEAMYYHLSILSGYH